MTRIVAGSLGGRRLAVPPGDRTRPTTDRVREALFSSLESLLDFDGARVLDAFAGSGAIGLEALSRGASAVAMIEADAKVLPVLRANVATLQAAPAAQVLAGKVATVLAAGTAEPYDLVYFDPPYGLDDADLDVCLDALSTGGWLAPDAVVVVERGRRANEPLWPADVHLLRSRRYGETTLWYGRRS